MENLKIIRKAKHLTQSEVAKHLKISPGTLSQWETGKREPDIKSLINLSEFFNVSIDFLVSNPYQNDTTLKGILDNESFIINKTKIISLINNITKFNDYEFNLLDGYIKGIIDANKK